jgi:hypothetical protein
MFTIVLTMFTIVFDDLYHRFFTMCTSCLLICRCVSWFVCVWRCLQFPGRTFYYCLTMFTLCIEDVCRWLWLDIYWLTLFYVFVTFVKRCWQCVRRLWLFLTICTSFDVYMFFAWRCFLQCVFDDLWLWCSHMLTMFFVYVDHICSYLFIDADHNV